MTMTKREIALQTALDEVMDRLCILHSVVTKDGSYEDVTLEEALRLSEKIQNDDAILSLLPGYIE